MSENLQAALLVLHKRIEAALGAQCGSAWKEVHTEPHLHYNELSVWVLLFEDSDPEEAHALFKRILVPFLEEVGEIQLTLMYYVVKDGQQFHLDFLTSTSEILSASGEALGVWQKKGVRRIWLFAASDSSRP